MVPFLFKMIGKRIGGNGRSPQSRLSQVVTIPDDIGAIADEVHAAYEAFDLVVTTGGKHAADDIC